MNTINPRHSFQYAGATINVYHADAGEGLPTHQHTFSHATICYAGSCVVRVKGKKIHMAPGTMPLDLPANIPHEIEALEFGTVFTNIFPTQVP
jgi:quercetin dioxygenase-like cupin family protein